MNIISALPLSIALLGNIHRLFKALRIDYEKRYTRSIFNLPTSLTSSKNGKSGKIGICVGLDEDKNFIYGVKIIQTQTPDYAMNDDYYRAEVYLLKGEQDYDMIGRSKEALINYAIDQYHKYAFFI